MKYLYYKTVTLIQSLCNYVIPVKIVGKNVKLSNVLVIFCLLCISHYSYSNYFLANAARFDPQVPVEVTGKILIKPPECASGKIYDKNLDECVPTRQRNGEGNGS